MFFESGFNLIRKYSINPVLKELTELRKEGVSLWHEGKECLSQESVDRWWKKHVNWKERCVLVVEKVDENLAGKIETLGIGQGYPYTTGINKDHNHKVWMQSAWNNRLDETITEIRNKKPQ